MAPDSLDAAGGVEFGEEANDHALSLPTAAPIGKSIWQTSLYREADALGES